MLIASQVIDEYVLSVEIQRTQNRVIFEALMVEISPVLPGAANKEYLFLRIHFFDPKLTY